jgi:hypothetical protein
MVRSTSYKNENLVTHIPISTVYIIIRLHETQYIGYERHAQLKVADPTELVTQVQPDMKLT